MFNYYFNIGVVYTLIGIIVAFTAIFIFKKKTIGNFWGALLVAVIGSFFGGIGSYLFKDAIAYLSNLNGSVNIFPPLIISIIFILILVRVSDKNK